MSVERTRSTRPASSRSVMRDSTSGTIAAASTRARFAPRQKWVPQRRVRRQPGPLGGVFHQCEDARCDQIAGRIASGVAQVGEALGKLESRGGTSTLRERTGPSANSRSA